MRWKTAKPPPPKGGDTRSRKVFAWRPTKVGEYTVWLERYIIEEQYFQPAGGNPGWWSEKGRYTLVYYY